MRKRFAEIADLVTIAIIRYAYLKLVSLPAPSNGFLCSVAIMLDHICGDVGPRAAQPSLAMYRYGTLLSLAELQKRLHVEQRIR